MAAVASRSGAHLSSGFRRSSGVIRESPATSSALIIAAARKVVSPRASRTPMGLPPSKARVAVASGPVTTSAPSSRARSARKLRSPARPPGNSRGCCKSLPTLRAKAQVPGWCSEHARGARPAKSFADESAAASGLRVPSSVVRASRRFSFHREKKPEAPSSGRDPRKASVAAAAAPAPSSSAPKA